MLSMCYTFYVFTCPVKNNINLGTCFADGTSSAFLPGGSPLSSLSSSVGKTSTNLHTTFNRTSNNLFTKDVFMELLKKIEVFGDSVLKGIQLRSGNKYCVDNNIDTELLSEKFGLSITNHSKMGCTITKGAELIKRFFGGDLRSEKKDEFGVVMNYGGNDCDFNWTEISENPDAQHKPRTPLAVFEETYRKVIKALKERGVLPILCTMPPLEPQKYFDWLGRGLNKANILAWLGGSVSTIYRYQENYSKAVERIAQTERVPLVDLRGEFLTHRRIDGFFCEDGIHPNTKGQGLITAAFVRFAERVLHGQQVHLMYGLS